MKDRKGMKSYYFFYYCLVNLLFRKDYNYISHLHLSLFVFAISLVFSIIHFVPIILFLYFHYLFLDTINNIILFLFYLFVCLFWYLFYLYLLLLFFSLHYNSICGLSRTIQIWDWEKIGIKKAHKAPTPPKWICEARRWNEVYLSYHFHSYHLFLPPSRSLPSLSRMKRGMESEIVLLPSIRFPNG